MRRIFAVSSIFTGATVLAATLPSGWIGTYQTTQTQLISPAMSDNYLTVVRMSGGGIRFMFQAVSAGCIGEAQVQAF